MKHFLILAFVCVIAGAAMCPPGDPHQRHTPKLRDSVPTHFPSIVSIRMKCGRCTGWVVEKNTFFTAAHCFDDGATTATAVFEDGRESKLILIKKGDRFKLMGDDMAVLKGDDRGAPALRLAPEIPKAHFKCLSLGYGMETVQKAVACYGARAAFEGLYGFAGEVDFGDSGGPVLTTHGEVAGIQVSIEADDAPVFFVVPVETIHKFLHEAGI